MFKFLRADLGVSTDPNEVLVVFIEDGIIRNVLLRAGTIDAEIARVRAADAVCAEAHSAFDRIAEVAAAAQVKASEPVFEVE